MKLIVHPKTDEEAVIHDTPHTYTHILSLSNKHTHTPAKQEDESLMKLIVHPEIDQVSLTHNTSHIRTRTLSHTHTHTC